MKFNWSIRSKFLFVMTGLLGLGLGVYLLMAVTSFKTDKTQLVFDLTRSQVANLTSELETEFSGVSEKLKVFALLPPALQTKMVGELLTDTSSVVAIAIFKNGEATPDKTFHQERFLETYGVDVKSFDETLAAVKMPMADIQRTGEAVWNASPEKGPPLIGYGRLVVAQDHKGIPIAQWVVAGYIKLDKFIKSVSMVRLSEIVVSNQAGDVLLHPDAGFVLRRPNVKADPLFTEAVNAKTKISVVHRDPGQNGVLAALGKGFGGQIIVVARASEAQVFKVVGDLTVRTLLFGSLVLTLVILAAFLVSRSLTENIALLTERMESAAKGDLSTRIRLRGRDETIILANTFNQMIDDLKTSRDALETMNRELDHKVKERTAQLEEQHKKVKEVQEALVRTTRLASVGEIAGRTAHEVLNPLTILLTRLGLVQKRLTVTAESPLGLLEEIHSAWKKDFSVGGLDGLLKSWREPSSVYPGKNLFEEDLDNVGRCTEELREGEKRLEKDLKFVKDEGERIGKIINNMRRLGHSKSETRAYSVHAIIGDCCQIMNDLFETRGFKIEQVFKATEYESLVDRDELIQALTNLMRNSLQALEEAPAGPDRHLILRTYNRDREIFIEIEDNGAGVKPEHQPRLFEASFTTKSQDDGTGLGLGIARRFIRGFGGDIEFAGSEPLTKTTFRIRLPLVSETVSKGAVA